MLRLLAAAALALILPCAAWANAVVESLTGEARAGDKALSRGELVLPGTQVTTGRDSQLVLAFEDGQKMVLGPGSRFRLVTFRYREAEPRNDYAVFDLLRGALRVVTGALGGRSRQAFQLRTPQVTIGVRGTDFMVFVANQTYVNVTAGSISTANAAGTVVFGAGSVGSIASSATLGLPVSAAQLPSAASSAFGSLSAANVSAGGAASGALAGAAGTAAGAGIATPVVLFGAAAAAAAAASDDDGGSSATTHH